MRQPEALPLRHALVCVPARAVLRCAASLARTLDCMLIRLHLLLPTFGNMYETGMIVQAMATRHLAILQRQKHIHWQEWPKHLVASCCTCHRLLHSTV